MRPDAASEGTERNHPLITATQQGGAHSRVALPASEIVSISPADALKVVLETLEDAKAEDTVSIDIANKSSLADYMVVASGRSHRHVGAIADRLMDDLKAAGIRDARVEGLPNCDWVLVDAGDVIVHLFRPEVRSFYNLEKMWQAEPVTGPVLVISR